MSSTMTTTKLRPSTKYQSNKMLFYSERCTLRICEGQISASESLFTELLKTLSLQSHADQAGMLEGEEERTFSRQLSFQSHNSTLLILVSTTPLDSRRLCCSQHWIHFQQCLENALYTRTLRGNPVFAKP